MSDGSKSPEVLTIKFYYRNVPPNDYFTLLLKKFPNCWFKNEYTTEDGDCGIWIGKMTNGEIDIQERSWIELGYEELIYDYGVDG